MPAKGGGLVNGPRYNPLSKDLYKRFIEENPCDISYKEFCDIIHISNARIADRISNNIGGFKLPASLGYCAVTRYKPKPGKRSVNFQKTRELGVTVYHTNFHSFGYSSRIMWLTDQLATCKFVNIYKFVAARALARSVAKNTLAGKVYNECTYSAFKQKKVRINVDKYFK